MAQEEPPRLLLLLPPAPSPASHAAFKTAYGDTLTQVLKEASAQAADSRKGAILEIALACPHLVGQAHAPRSSVYAPTQALVAGVYKLICIVAARENVNVEDVVGVDVRVLIVAWTPYSDQSGRSGANKVENGPVVSLETLARSGRPWQFAFAAESEEGEAMVRAFVAAKGSGEEISRVQSGPVMKHTRASDSDGTADPKLKLASSSGQKHFHVAVGGTWDHIHIGHKLLLTMTVFALDEGEAEAERSITIGITGDQLLVNKKHAEHLESWSDRQRSVMRFVDALLDFEPQGSIRSKQITSRDDPGPNGKSIDIHYPTNFVVRCTEIQDPFGPTITDPLISALVLSAETRAGGQAINDKRSEKDYANLEVFEVDVLDADEENADAPAKQGFESKLSSTATREKLARRTQSSL